MTKPPDQNDEVRKSDVHSSEARLDDLLREAYEPGPGTARRIARAALAEDDAASKTSGAFWNPWTRGVALGALAALLLVAALWLAAPPEPDGMPAVQVARTSIDNTARAEPARLRITNDAGTVTVTTADGTRWIAFEPTPASTGGPSS